MPDDSGQRRLAVTSGALVAASLAAIACGSYVLGRKRMARCTGHVRRIITVGRPIAGLDAAWLELLPRAMEPVADVAVDATHIRWTLPAPLTQTFMTAFEWTQPGHVLCWKNVEVEAKPFSGSVTFANAPGNGGSEVSLHFDTALPDAVVGPVLAIALRRFKSLIETGELPSLEGNPSGRWAATGDEEE